MGIGRMMPSRRAAAALLILTAASIVAITLWIRRTSASHAGRPSVPAAAAALMERAEADFYARRYEDAARSCRDALESTPRNTAASLLLADVYVQSGRGDEALSMALAAVDPQGDPRDRAGLGRAFAADGKRDEALRIAESLARDPVSATDGALAFDLGLIYAALDMREPAFRWLEAAAAKRDPALLRLRVDPRLDALRGDPRYLALLAKLNLPAE
jgi:tetratricopeptide (TPR) repeat protein